MSWQENVIRVQQNSNTLGRNNMIRYINNDNNNNNNNSFVLHVRRLCTTPPVIQLQKKRRIRVGRVCSTSGGEEEYKQYIVA